VLVDGVKLRDNAIPLVDDRQEHSVEVRICRVSPVKREDELAPSQTALKNAHSEAPN
jgi:hypothetical protein